MLYHRPSYDNYFMNMHLHTSEAQNAPNVGLLPGGTRTRWGDGETGEGGYKNTAKKGGTGRTGGKDE